jgi:hypothetical protein
LTRVTGIEFLLAGFEDPDRNPQFGQPQAGGKPRKSRACDDDGIAVSLATGGGVGLVGTHRIHSPQMQQAVRSIDWRLLALVCSRGRSYELSDNPTEKIKHGS